MATSPNYAWAEPDNSSLVKNGAADIRTLGDAIDTSVWNVGYGQAGKNKIINGDLGIWQRGTTFTNPSLYTYTADRFQAISNHSGGTLTVTRQSFTAGAAPVAGYESAFFLRTASAATTGSSVNVVAQPIEDVRTFAGQPVTVSFWAKASVAGNFSASLTQNFGSGGSGSVATTFIASTAATTSWVRYTGTATLPSITGKTIGTSSYVGLEIYQPVNGTFSFDIWGVQVEYGSKATPFQTASGDSIQGELAMCQRYYVRFGGAAVYEAMGQGSGWTTTRAGIQVRLPVTMRKAPTTLDYALPLAVSDSVTATSLTAASLGGETGKDVAVFRADVASGLTVYRPYVLITDNSTSAYIGFSAEL